MAPHPDHVDALPRPRPHIAAAPATVLAAPPETADLENRLLAQIVETLRADAALILISETEGPRLATVGIDAATAGAMAVEVRHALERSETESCMFRAGESGSACAGWSATLAARLRTESGPDGLLALFSRRADAFDARRDGRLAAILGANAALVLSWARRETRLRKEAERRGVQIEEIERVRGALERHSREIERSLAIRTRFFAAMSHELRTPINAIVGYNDLMRQGIYGELNERQADAVDKIGRCAGQLLALVNDVLELSRIDSGQMRIQRSPTDLAALVGEAAASVQFEADAKRLGLELEVDERLPTVETDPDRVRQILLNLLSNAVKFTESGAITLRVRHLPAHARFHAALRPSSPPGANGWIGIAVHDTGVGIPEEQIQVIFEEFVRGPRTAKDAPGTGLGLAISSHLARLLGGDLRAESDPGRSSTFMLFIPCPAPAGHRVGRSDDDPRARAHRAGPGGTR